MVAGADYYFTWAVWLTFGICADLSFGTVYLYNFLAMDRLKHVFASVLGISKDSITPELSPQTTPTWDSLNAIVLITEIEKEFSVTFAYAEAMGVKNFGDVVALVQSKGIDLHE